MDPQDFLPSFDALADRSKGGIDPAMVELNALGPMVLPSLLQHLTDARPTQIRLNYGPDSLTLLCDYDPRWRRALRVRHQRDVNQQVRNSLGVKERQINEYTVKVGDLCLDLVGRIVNRDLHVLSNMCVNSAVENPILAERIRSDWGGITRQELFRSLEVDSDPEIEGWNADSVARLVAFFPREGTHIACRLLSLPIYGGHNEVYRLADQLLQEDSKPRWQLLIRDFESIHGNQVTKTIPYWLWWEATKPDSDEMRRKRNCTRIIETLFPRFDPLEPHSTVIDAGALHSIVRSLQFFHSSALDKAVAEAFLRASRGSHRFRLYRYLDLLAIATYRRLAHTRLASASESYLRKRIAMIKANASPVDSAYLPNIVLALDGKPGGDF